MTPVTPLPLRLPHLPTLNGHGPHPTAEQRQTLHLTIALTGPNQHLLLLSQVLTHRLPMIGTSENAQAKMLSQTLTLTKTTTNGQFKVLRSILLIFQVPKMQWVVIMQGMNPPLGTLKRVKQTTIVHPNTNFHQRHI